MSATVHYLPKRIFDGNHFRSNCAIEVENNTIKRLIPAPTIPEDKPVKEFPDLTLAPAFKDLQIYGGNDKMFSLHPSVDNLKATYAYSRAGGVTAFMATVPTSGPEIMKKAMNAVNTYWEQGLPGLLGLQLEGPYLNPKKKGAHPERYFQKPKLSDVQKLVEQSQGSLKMMTVAPEICSSAVMRYLTDQDILLSAGHSDATYEEARWGFDQGISMCTHLYNAMSGLHHREPGLVGAAFDSHIYASIIPDGIHVNESAFRIASKIMGDRLFFITDAITEGKTEAYHYIRQDDHIELPDGTLAGSCLTMETAVKKAIQMGISAEDALKKASTIPAKLLDKTHKWGKIAAGYQVDWVLLDDDFNVKNTLTGL